MSEGKKEIINGNCLEVLQGLPSECVDAIVTDPPYELGFMGKAWDASGIAYNVDLWHECLRVLKPGGHLLAFGGTRTYHRMAVAIEDAGFEVRDMLEWIYASGFPKSLNVGKAVDKLQGNEREEYLADIAFSDSDCWGVPNKNSKGTKGMFLDAGKVTQSGKVKRTKGNSEWEGFGTALKPAHEPIILARRPLSEKTIVENVLKYGTGAIDIDSCRIPTSAYTTPTYSISDIIPLHILSELRCKIYKQLFSFVCGTSQDDLLSSDVECVENWRKLKDSLAGYPVYLRLYDGLLPLFQEDDQVSFRQLHDVHNGISCLHKELDDSHDSDIVHLSTCDVLLQLVRSYLTPFVNNSTYKYTTQISKSQGHFRRGNVVGDNRTSKAAGQFGDGAWVAGTDLTQGRFPANIICTDDALNDGVMTKSGHLKSGHKRGDGTGNSFMGGGGTVIGDYGNDSGSKSRYFDIDVWAEKHGLLQFPKASKRERNEGCGGLEEKPMSTRGADGQRDKNAIINNSNSMSKNNHPTVKPVHLCAWLVRLVSKEGDTVLDPFAGSGTTGVACKKLNRNFILIEQNEEYIEIIKKRVADSNKNFEQQTLFGNEM